MNPVARAMDLNSLLGKNLSINNMFNQYSYQNHNNYVMEQLFYIIASCVNALIIAQLYKLKCSYVQLI